MLAKRKKTRLVRVGTVAIGGGSPVSVQSMTKTKTSDVAATTDSVMKAKEKPRSW